MSGSEDNAYASSSYYCSGGSCYLCNSGYKYSSKYGGCERDPCTSAGGDGCGSSTSGGYSVAGYCSSSSQYCVNCNSGYYWTGSSCALSAESSCTDGVDNDGDGYKDYCDSDCSVPSGYTKIGCSAAKVTVSPTSIVAGQSVTVTAYVSGSAENSAGCDLNCGNSGSTNSCSYWNGRSRTCTYSSSGSYRPYLRHTSTGNTAYGSTVNVGINCAQSDGSSSICSSCGYQWFSTWNGEGSANCCGDDSGENVVSSPGYGTSCCNNQADCVSSSGTCYSYNTVTGNLLCGPYNEFVACNSGRSCYSLLGRTCVYVQSIDGKYKSWDWVSSPSAETNLECYDGVDNDCDGKVDCADSDCSGSCYETSCYDGVDNDLDGKVDFCDSDCSLPSGYSLLGCAAAKVTASSTNLPTGTSMTLTLTIQGNAESGYDCSLYCDNGDAYNGGSVARCNSGSRSTSCSYSSAGTYRPFVQSGDVPHDLPEVAGPYITVQNNCPSVTHGGTSAGCSTYDQTLAHTDSNYYCSGYAQCYICDVRGGVQYKYSTRYNQCVPPYCSYGCSSSTSGGTSSLGYCPSSSYYCVSCNSGYVYDQDCLECKQACPSAVQGGQYSGCFQGVPSHAQAVSFDYYHASNSCSDTQYACQISIDYLPTCYQCDSDYHWSGSQCVPDCTANGGSCGSDTQCCSNYCSDRGPGGSYISSSQYHCCPMGYYWNTGTNQCTQYATCYPSPCPYASGYTFTPSSVDVSWWGNSNCIDRSQACCYTNIYGSGGYYDLDNSIEP